MFNRNTKSLQIWTSQKARERRRGDSLSDSLAVSDVQGFWPLLMYLRTAVGLSSLNVALILSHIVRPQRLTRFITYSTPSFSLIGACRCFISTVSLIFLSTVSVRSLWTIETHSGGSGSRACLRVRCPDTGLSGFLDYQRSYQVLLHVCSHRMPCRPLYTPHTLFGPSVCPFTD